MSELDARELLECARCGVERFLRAHLVECKNDAGQTFFLVKRRLKREVDALIPGGPLKPALACYDVRYNCWFLDEENDKLYERDPETKLTHVVDTPDFSEVDPNDMAGYEALGFTFEHDRDIESMEDDEALTRVYRNENLVGIRATHESENGWVAGYITGPSVGSVTDAGARYLVKQKYESETGGLTVSLEEMLVFTVDRVRGVFLERVKEGGAR